MLLISLMLAATAAPMVEPDIVQRREASRARVPSAVRSKRLIELEATVQRLPLAAAEQGHGSGPKGM